MNIIYIIIIILSIFQLYVCWMTYLNWYRNEMKYVKIFNSCSIIGMVLILPFIIWIPILPVYIIHSVTDKKYLTIKFNLRWKMN